MPEPDDIFEIEDVATLEVILDETRAAILETVATPRSVAEVAEELRVPRTRLYHHFNLLADAGVIRVVDERRVGAKTEKIYQVAAKNFRPSEGMLAGQTPTEQVSTIVDSLFAVTRSDLMRSVDEGRIQLDQRNAARSATFVRTVAKLTPTRADELVNRLESLLEEFQADGDASDASPFGILTVIYPSSRPSA